MDALSKEIRKNGLTMVQFCDKVLNTDYKAFRARIRQGRLRLSEIKQIIIYTNLSFEDLFMELDEQTPTSKERDQPNKEQDKIKPVVKVVAKPTFNNDFIDTW